MMNPALHSKPWYREPWPWFLMSLPAAAVIGGLATVWIAFSSADGLVVGDYYKAGLAVNQTLARDDAAHALALVATLKSLDGALELTLTGHLQAYPPQLILALVHPTQQGRDKMFTLHHIGSGNYRAELPTLPVGKWHAQLTDTASTWRLAGVLYTPLNRPAMLGASETLVHPSPGE